MTEPKRPIEILLVEDSAADAELTRELLSRSRARHQVQWVRDGIEALARLRAMPAAASDAHRGSPSRPDLILLDLNLPRMSGLELLTELKRDPRLAPIPVIVLTMSRLDDDVRDAYARQAAAFVTKPVELKRFARVIEALDAFWLDAARLPLDGYAGVVGHE